jgi:cbb3-type cytochrome oxidase subunit 3
MLTDSFRNVFHVEIYALIGFIIFFTFFIFVSVQAFRMKKDEVNKLSSMPLDDSETETQEDSGNRL